MNASVTTERHSAHRLSIFNHKGGVGKTTLAVNIGAALARMGKRVLLADTDPQCNLTCYLLNDEIVDDLLASSSTNNGRTLWTAMQPAMQGNGTFRMIKPYEPGIDGLYLLPGDIELSRFELLLHDLWTDCFKRYPKGYLGTTALSALINEYCAAHNIDYVFYDAGPNIGPLNRIIVLDSDYFIIPAACDLFSIRALTTLGRTLASWIEDWDMLCSYAPTDAYLFPGRPCFLGHIPQRFRTYFGGMTKASSEFFSDFQHQLTKNIIHALRKKERALAPLSSSEAKLGEVKDFSKLVQLSQRQGKPLWDVSDGDSAHRTQARRVFDGIARKIVERTSSPQ